ncbi:MAG: hypothetical protein NG712_03870 [Omnitrophica bacterium]|nr:hypothetical protein [Candidatus Omnitrophota bacterium]
MAKISTGRFLAILTFLLLLVGAAVSFQRIAEDISIGKYFNQPQEFRYEIIVLTSYILIILFLLRYGYYLAVNRVNWKIIKDDPLFLLNRRHFAKPQWLFNLLLFWLGLIGFIYSLAVSAMKGTL